MLKWRRSNVVDQSFSQLKKSETYSFLSLVSKPTSVYSSSFQNVLTYLFIWHPICFVLKITIANGIIILVLLYTYVLYYLLRSLSNWTDIYTKVNCKQTMDGTYLLLLLMSLGHFSASLEMEKLCDEKCTSFCII